MTDQVEEFAQRGWRSCQCVEETPRGSAEQWLCTASLETDLSQGFNNGNRWTEPSLHITAYLLAVLHTAGAGAL